MDLTIRYSDANGYSYNETSVWWKDQCSHLASFAALHWPGYATDVREVVIEGQPVVIQLWKGLCPNFPRFLGVPGFPGGVGAEVGVYRRIPGKGEAFLWWPFPELGAQIEFTLINPVNGQPLFSAGPEKSYWLNKWMDEDSYATYQGDHGTPGNVEDYILDYRINGKGYPRWPASAGDVIAYAQAAPWLLLLS